MNGFCRRHLIFSIIVILGIPTDPAALATPFDPLDDPSVTGQVQPFFDFYFLEPFSPFFEPLTIPLVGAPFPFGPQPLPGNTDTVVRKLDSIDPLPVGGSGTIDIEIVELQLKSVAPVQLGGLDWDVDIILDPFLTQDLGQMIVNHELPNGGSFSSTLPIKSLLIFTEVGNPSNTFNHQFSDVFNSTGAWSHTPGPNDQHIPLNGVGGNFFPDIDPITGQRLSRTQTGLNSNSTLTASAATPEPGTLSLLAIGGLLLANRRRYR